MDIVSRVQVFLLALGGAICFLIAILSQLLEYQIKVRKRALFVVEMCTSMMLLSDMLTFIYQGDPSRLGYWVVRISNTLIFFLVYIELIGLNMYIGSHLREQRAQLMQKVKLINIVSVIGFLLIIISQFTGWFYTFDSNNNYVRGPLFILSYVMPLIVFLITLVGIISSRKGLPRLILISTLIFSILPLICALLQAIFYGLSLFNLSIGLSAIIIFALALVDQNNFLRITAATDRMTGLPNTYGYILELNRICDNKEITKYNAFYFDIVRMGLINRRYGNQVGDYVIRTYARLVRDNMQKDEVLGRLGGNFFVAVVKKERTQDFLNLLSGMDVSLIAVGIGDSVRVSSVAGVYQIEDATIRPEQIMANVSMAVSIAKNIKKRPYVFLTKELMDELNEHRQMQEMVPKAMEKREFVPFYQPKVNADTYRLSGAEALARWNHEGQFVAPYKFIPIIEQNEFICTFDFYMLNRVCEDIKGWLEQGLDVPVISVNFSRKNLGNPILAEEIYNVVKKYDIPFNLVQIEITETIDEYPLSYLQGVVEALQRYGLSAAIDDFGVGSSSLMLLKEVPFDVLKIDKSFVDTLTEKDCKFLRHIVEMAKEIGASVISEGVETAEQVEVLKSLGCHEIQGYYFDKPLIKSEFEGRLQNSLYSMKK